MSYWDRDEDYGRRRRARSRWYGEDYEPRYRGRLEESEEGYRLSRRRGYAEDVGQGGWFGDPREHARVGRIGGEVGGRIRHERAMRARHDLPQPYRSSREEFEEDFRYSRPRGRYW